LKRTRHFLRTAPCLESSGWLWLREHRLVGVL